MNVSPGYSLTDDVKRPWHVRFSYEAGLVEGARFNFASFADALEFMELQFGLNCAFRVHVWKFPK